MLDSVVMCGLRRAGELMPVNDIQQVLGRVGRKYGTKGEAIVICNSEDDGYAYRCVSGVADPVVSEMSLYENAAFYILPKIDRICDEESFEKWYKRTLAYAQGIKTSWNDVKNHLIENRCINDDLSLTDLGKISVSMYVRPKRAYNMMKKIDESFSNGDFNEFNVISWILSEDRIGYYIPEDDSLFSEYKSNLSSCGYFFDNNEAYSGFAYYCAINPEGCPRWMRQNVAGIKKSIDRDFAILSRISELFGKECKDGMESAYCSFVNKIPEELTGIMIGLKLKKRSSVIELSEMGISDKDNAVEEYDLISTEGSSSLLKDLNDGGVITIPEEVIRERKESEIEFDF